MNGKTLTVANSFFKLVNNAWLEPSSLPRLPLDSWDLNTALFDCELINNDIPILFGKAGFDSVNDNTAHLNLDIFGSAFFMITRYEECIISERDIHARFPAKASVAYREGFLDRPIVNEYFEILWSAINYFWSGIQKKEHSFRVIPSSDVDNPYTPQIKSLSATARLMAGDLVKRRSPSLALKSGLNAIYSKFGNYKYDSFHTFDMIMDVNEKYNNKVTFNFITGNTDPLYDSFYTLDEKRIRDLLKQISLRGHKIGLHCSYGSYLSPETIKGEYGKLQNVLAEEGIDQEISVNRMHYLRWDSSSTARHLNDAGIASDSSLGYADHPGFRSGACFDFPMYDIVGRVPMKIIQRPLILMECSVIDEEYLGLGYTGKALQVMINLKKQVARYGGNFTLLWHNSSFLNTDDFIFYRQLVNSSAINGY